MNSINCQTDGAFKRLRRVNWKSQKENWHKQTMMVIMNNCYYTYRGIIIYTILGDGVFPASQWFKNIDFRGRPYPFVEAIKTSVSQFSAFAT